MLDRFVLFVEAGLGMKIIDRYFIRAEEADAVSKNEKAILDIKAFAKRISWLGNYDNINQRETVIESFILNLKITVVCLQYFHKVVCGLPSHH